MAGGCCRRFFIKDWHFVGGGEAARTEHAPDDEQRHGGRGHEPGEGRGGGRRGRRDLGAVPREGQHNREPALAPAFTLGVHALAQQVLGALESCARTVSTGKPTSTAICAGRSSS